MFRTLRISVLTLLALAAFGGSASAAPVGNVDCPKCAPVPPLKQLTKQEARTETVVAVEYIVLAVEKELEDEWRSTVEAASKCKHRSSRTVTCTYTISDTESPLVLEGIVRVHETEGGHLVWSLPGKLRKVRG